MRDGRQTGRFRASEGISCEGCHGPGSLWLSSHSNPNTARSELMAQGLYDTWNSTSKAELCLSCHLGDQNQRITHKIMAAGHPRLVFELVTFTDAQPRHYDVDELHASKKSLTGKLKNGQLGKRNMDINFLTCCLILTNRKTPCSLSYLCTNAIHATIILKKIKME